MLVFVLLEIISGSKQTGQRLSKPKPEPVAKFAKLVHHAFMQGTQTKIVKYSTVYVLSLSRVDDA